jgi:hypothetical protein
VRREERFRGKEVGGVISSTTIHLVPKLGMGRFIFLLPVYAFMLWTEENYIFLEIYVTFEYFSRYFLCYISGKWVRYLFVNIPYFHEMRISQKSFEVRFSFKLFKLYW